MNASVSWQWGEVSADKDSGSGKEVEFVRLWNFKTGELSCLLYQKTWSIDDLTSLAYSPDGRTLAVGGERFIKIFQIPSHCSGAGDH